MNLLDLMVKVAVDDQASSKVDSLASGSISRLGKLATKAGAVAGVVSSVFEKAMGVVSSSIDSAVSRVDTMNNFPRVMEGLGYSADSAAASIQLMSDHLTGLPTRLDAMTTSVQKIVPTVKDVGKATDIMLSFNDALLAGGASTQVQEAALEQFSQVLAKGKPELEDWRSIQTAMPGQLDQVAQAMFGAGASSNDLYEAMKDGTVSIEDFEQAFIDLDQNGLEGFASFAEQAKTGTAGIATSFANLQNAVTKAVAKVIDAIGVENITAPIESARTAINGAADWLAGKVEWAKGILGKLGEGIDPSKFERLSNALGAIGDGISSLGDGLQGAIDMFVESGDAAQVLGDAIDAVSAALQWITDNGAAVVSVLSGVAGAFAAFEIISTVAGAVSTLAAVFGPLLEVIGMVVSSIAAGAPVFSTLAAGIGLVASPVGIAAAAIGALIAIVVALATNAGGCRDMVTSAFGAIVSFISSIPASVGGFLSDIIGKVQAWAGDMASGAQRAASDFASSLLDRLSSLPGEAMSAGRSIVQGIIDGIMGMIGAAGNAIGSVVDTIASYLPHSPAKRGAFSGKGWTPYSGRSIVHGLAEGIAELADEPADAMASVMEGVSATTAVSNAAVNGVVSVNGSSEGGTTPEGAAAIIAWLAENLPAIISEFTPVMGESEFGRKARKAVAYA